MQIDRRAGLTAAQLAEEYARPGRPVVLTDLGADWRATRTWTFAMLKERGAATSVLVEEGNAVQANRPRRRMTVAAYIDLVTAGTATEQKLYLAGLDLFSLFPDLRDDVDFRVLGAKRFWYRRAWLGAAGTGSGFHRDIGDNILAQVVGEKVVKLVSPAQSECMYESTRFDFLTYASDVDADDWDADRHPAFAGADVGETTIGPGEGLFIPTNWWHYTRSLTNSISVNCGGMTVREGAHAWRYFAQYGAHLMHLYRWGDCLCHPQVAPETAAEAQRR